MRLSKSKKEELSSYEVQSFYIPEIKEKPPEDDDKFLEIITPKEAIDILKSNLPLENKRVVGDLIMSKLDVENPYGFDMEDGRKIQIAGLPEYQDFERLPYTTSIEVKKCVFDGKIILPGTQFTQKVSFVSSRFRASLDFQSAIFNESLSFYGCYFQDGVSFSDAVFGDTVNFDRSHFKENADFFNSTYRKGASFNHTLFQKNCTFTSSKFNSLMLVHPCVDFSNAICHEAAYFMNARFDGIADFYGTQFRLKVDFTDAAFKYFNIKQAQLNWFEIKWEQIGSERLLFGSITIKGSDKPKKYITNKEFNTFFSQRLDTPLTEQHRQYDILKGIFLKQGDFVSADKCFYDWKQVERKKSKIGWNPESWIVKVFHVLNWLSCGYGVKPIRTLLFSSVLIFLFGIIYSIIEISLNTDISFILPINISLSLFIGNIEYSFLVFMNFADNITKAQPIQYLIYFIERLLGWFTLLLFVTTYTRIMLR